MDSTDTSIEAVRARITKWKENARTNRDRYDITSELWTYYDSQIIAYSDVLSIL
ncbi:MAG TPA: hypothetical protein VN039_00095 [Nitrospira sp.]|nr:hypothetical protein [Nitrospira sp.]